MADGLEKMHVGPIHSSVAGRTDHLPMHVPSGAYVIPAESVSAIGEGNTMNGFQNFNKVFGVQRLRPGYTPTPINAAGGEYVIAPDVVQNFVGGGDLDLGHKVLDQFIMLLRADTIKTLKKLPGPRKN